MYGIHKTYKSDYPNQVHQLNLSISKNHYLLKNGEIKYQVKKFDINWKNYHKTGKRHLVNFLIRDHFSNCFYAEIYPIDEMPNMIDFLFNAWRKKQKYEFRGIPHHLILGKHILDKFPEIQNLEKSIGTKIQLASSGFATGVRSLRDWENNIRFTAFYDNSKFIRDFQKNIELICRKINLRDSGKTEPNLLKWARNKPQGVVINDKNKFEILFNEEAVQ